MKLSSQILLAFSIVIVISVLDSYINYQLSLKVQKNTEFVSRSETIIRSSTALHKTIIEMQSGFRGFLLTGDSAFLKSYEEGLQVAPPLFSELDQLISASGMQARRLDSIENLHRRWVNYSAVLINARQMTSNDDASSLYETLLENQTKKKVGMKMNEDISAIFRNFDRFEYGVRQARRETLIQSIQRTHRYSLVFLIFIIFVGALSTYYIISLITRRISTMVKMAENISKGKFTSIGDTSNDELTGLSTSLNVMSDKLSQNISKLEKTNTELNQFAHVVSHDLKAPVRGIYHVIQWIEEDEGDKISPQLKKYLDIIAQRTTRMEHLINGLLEYARLRHKTNIERIDTKALVEEVIDSVVPRPYEVEVSELPVVYGERIKLQQVFSNLISNSVKYMPPTAGKIRITCDKVKDQFFFSVQDDGIGIDAEYHEKIFEIFQTLRERHQKESTGIGLAIVKKILEDLHSNITVVSSAGNGATFTFSWPNQKHLYEKSETVIGRR